MRFRIVPLLAFSLASPSQAQPTLQQLLSRVAEEAEVLRHAPKP